MRGYHTPSQQKVSSDYERSQQNSSGMKPESQVLKDGETTLFIMPPWVEGGDWKKEMGYHWNAHPANLPIPCLKFFGDSCPVCEALDRVMGDYPDRKDKLTKMRANRRFFVNAINQRMLYAGHDIVACIGIPWELPVMVGNAVTEVLHQDIDALNPWSAFLLQIHREAAKSKNEFPKYNVLPAKDVRSGELIKVPWLVLADSSPDNEGIQRALDHMTDLDAYFPKLSDQDMGEVQRATDNVLAMFYGRAPVGSFQRPETANGGGTTVATGQQVGAAAAVPTQNAQSGAAPVNGGSGAPVTQPPAQQAGGAAPINPPSPRRYPPEVDPAKYPCYAGQVPHVETGNRGFDANLDKCLKCQHQQPCQAQGNAQ